jgi:hypothetical protein
MALSLAGCGQTTEQQLAKEDHDAKAAQARAIAALDRAERRSAAAGLELVDRARVACQDTRLHAGHSAPAEAHRLAIRFARGLDDADTRPLIVAACEKELMR